MHGIRRLPLFATALLLLASLGVVLAAEAYEHTDDGCAVEIHCLPCQWQRGATVVPAVVPQPCVPVDLGSAFLGPLPRQRLDGKRLESPSRAPPLAS